MTYERDMETGMKTQMATKKQHSWTGGLANHWETSGCQRNRGSSVIHIKTPQRRAVITEWGDLSLVTSFANIAKPPTKLMEEK